MIPDSRSATKSRAGLIEGPGLIFFRFNRKRINDLCLCGGVKKFQNIKFKIREKTSARFY